jgi:hypothetical protein
MPSSMMQDIAVLTGGEGILIEIIANSLGAWGSAQID